jgi:ABC-type spermidine/putrescine transport system permease subunit II
MSERRRGGAGARLTGGAVEGGLRGYLVLGLLFLYLPIAVVVLYSFNDSRYVQVWKGFSVRWYETALANPNFTDALAVSVRIAFINALIAAVLGTLLAVGLGSLGRSLRLGVRAIMVLTIVIPEVIMGLALLIYFAKVGVPLSTFTILAGHVVFNTSIVAFIVGARLSSLETTLEEAAADLGAPPWKSFLTITVPLLSPAIFAGALLAFTFSFDDYVLSFFLAGPQTLPLRIWGAIRFGASPEANAVASLIIVFSVTMIAFAVIVYRWRSRQLGSGGEELFTPGA